MTTLEQIRAEIDTRFKEERIQNTRFYYDVLEIIDKYAEQEPCDDAISRDAVNTLVDELARAISDERCHIPQRGRDTGHIMHDILDLPSVTQKSGKWGASCTCSICGQWKILESEKNGGKYKFCHNCGAKMESEDKE